MFGLRLYGANDLRLDEIPKPNLPAEGMLIRVHACSICGSDIRNIKAGGTSHGMTLPRVLGHEFSGEIAEMDGKIEGYHIGDRVLIAPVVPCGKCDFCAQGLTNMCTNRETISYEYDGGFAEYIAIPKKLIQTGGIIPIPSNITYEQAAITEPLSCVLNGQEISKVGLGDTVVIIGAGPLGVAHAEVAKILGASKVIMSEVSEDRQERAESSNSIDVVINPTKVNLVEEIMKETSNKGADVVIVAAPSGDAQVQALAIAGKRGRVNFFGGLPKGRSTITIDSNVIHYKELTINGTSDSRVIQMKKILQLIATGKIDTDFLITKVFPINEYKDAFELAANGKALKVVIRP
ncbi:MAG: alcohol dehydrogenase [Clostridiaceae bacterium]|jgi:L-iditol 2-dehydrogenase|nr:alcohol dehydrogenase [Clostridiaceae bacterium]